MKNCEFERFADVGQSAESAALAGKNVGEDLRRGVIGAVVAGHTVAQQHAV